MVQVIIDRAQWNAEFARLRQFEPALARSLRRNMREVGKEGVQEVQKTVLLPPPTDSPESASRGSRAKIAARTKFEVNFTKRSAGVRFKTSGGDLGNFAAGYNQKRPFRHRVFGKNVWVEQQGRPYFGVVLTADKTTHMVERLSQIIDDANQAIGAKF
jgi:hypothetical protein